MKIKYWCCIGLSPEKTEIYDTEDFGYTDEEWAELTQDEKEEGVYDWAMQHVSYGIKEA